MCIRDSYYTVTAAVTVTDDVLPGMQATVTIPEEEAVDAVILNKEALSFDETNSAYVLMESASGEMERCLLYTSSRPWAEKSWRCNGRTRCAYCCFNTPLAE